MQHKCIIIARSYYFCIMKQTGIGTRVLNCIIDTLIIFLITFAINKGWQFYVVYWHFTIIPFYKFFWGVLFVYYTFFESIWARTPGKWLSYSVVVSDKGNKPAFWQILLRSLIRLTVIDCFFYPFFEKTLHDYVSRTDVVQAQSRKLKA